MPRTPSTLRNVNNLVILSNECFLWASDNPQCAFDDFHPPFSCQCYQTSPLDFPTSMQQSNGESDSD